MKQTVKPGMELDVPSVHEIGQHLQSIFAATAEVEVKFHKILDSTVADANGNLNYVSMLGPRAGYVWAVRRLTLINTTNNIGNIAVFINDTQPSSLVYPALNVPQVITPGSEEFIVHPQEQIAFLGGGLGAGSNITFTGLVKEMPITQLGRMNF